MKELLQLQELPVPGTAPIDGGTATVHQRWAPASGTAPPSVTVNCNRTSNNSGSTKRINNNINVRINRSFKAIATLGLNDNEIEKLF
ncbi:unnamed protein product [Rhizophagus irregularis]|nr:unnamed protein product [Rhizophagus irregularis]